MKGDHSESQLEDIFFGTLEWFCFLSIISTIVTNYTVVVVVVVAVVAFMFLSITIVVVTNALRSDSRTLCPKLPSLNVDPQKNERLRLRFLETVWTDENVHFDYSSPCCHGLVDDIRFLHVEDKLAVKEDEFYEPCSQLIFTSLFGWKEWIFHTSKWQDDDLKWLDP